MILRSLLFTCAFLAVSLGVRAETETIAGLVDTDKMAKLLGDAWVRDRGLVLESADDVAKLSGAEKQMGEMLFQIMKPHGVVAAGEFSFSRTEGPLDNLTVKVFKFASPTAADTFRHLKYENEQAAPLYQKIKRSSAIIYDSLEMKKRIVFQGVFWVTCGHIQDDDLHLEILENCVTLSGIQNDSETEK